jgi:hypothetical protein
MGPRGYMPGIVREWLENEDGGILLLDEMDAANPALLVAINDILAIDAGRSFRFPDGVRLTRTDRHVIVGAGNTNGLGATADYSGRNNLDRATLNRFAFLDWDYDENLERVLAGDDETGIEWCAFAQRARSICQKNALPLLITPRSIMKGAASLRSGIKRRDVMEAFIFQGCDDDTRKTLNTLLKQDEPQAKAGTCKRTVCTDGMDDCIVCPACTLDENHDGRCITTAEANESL